MQTKHSPRSTAKQRGPGEAHLPRRQHCDPAGVALGCSSQPPRYGGLWADIPLLQAPQKEEPPRSEHQCHVASHSAVSMLLETDLSRRQPISPGRSSVAGGQEGRPTVPASPAPCLCTLRRGRQGLELLKVMAGKGLAQSHPGGRGPSPV